MLEAFRVESPPALFALLASLVAVIFWASRQRPLQTFFRYFPPLIWTYFVPMIASSLGLIPNDSPLYDTFMMRTILPVIIVLLIVSTDTAAVARVGPRAILMMLIGTLGIVVGAAASFGLFVHLLPEGTLRPDTWKGVASLSGSWIGGSPNMAAIAASLEVDRTLFGKFVVVDTVCAYTWLGVLIALVGWQDRIDRINRADATVMHELASRLAHEQAERSRPIRTGDLITMLAVGFAVSQICLWAGGWMAKGVARVEAANAWIGWLNFSQVLSAFGWGILLVTFVSIALSFTPLRRLEDAGASSIGYAGLYLLLTTFGAQADLRMIGADDLWLFAIGATWLAIHIIVLLIGARLLRAPLSLTAIASMANVGGTASAPVVAAAFHPSLAPVGLLLAILGGIIGTPIGLLVVGKVCAALAGAGGP